LARHLQRTEASLRIMQACRSEFAMMSSCLRRLNVEHLQTTIWHALLYAYIAVAAAPTVIDLLEKH
jgi:hypothetical protein